MTSQGYKRISDFFQSHEKLYFLLRIIYKYLPYPVFVAYPVLLGVLFWQTTGGSDRAVFVKALVIPAVTFLSVTVFRKLINFPRPYEKLRIEPLIKKDKKGQSFPSRHIASVFTIAMAFMYVNIGLGLLFFFIGIIMAISRVLAGVHFPRDVIAGALYSIVLGIFFYLPI